MHIHNRFDVSPVNSAHQAGQQLLIGAICLSYAMHSNAISAGVCCAAYLKVCHICGINLVTHCHAVVVVDTLTCNNMVPGTNRISQQGAMLLQLCAG